MFPHIIVDKSVLQMLTHEELDELRNVFEVICVPTLTREIIADLGSAQSRSQRSTAEQRVQDLARRMSAMHLVTPVTYKKLVLSNLYGTTIPLNGQVPVDTSARNVAASADGRRLLYDATLEQDLWARWARGEFSLSDQEKAQLWRDELSTFDIKRFNDGWAQFSRVLNLGGVRSIDEAIARADGALQSREPEALSASMAALFALLRMIPPEEVTLAVGHAAKRGITFALYAPYAASVVRLYLVFITASRAMLLPQRKTNLIDLQYLFYAPFGFGFASQDTLHQRLWPAATSRSVFMTGDQLKADLAARVTWRKQFERLSDDERRRHHDAYSWYPVELPGSPINAVWNTAMMPREKFVADLRRRRPLNQVQDEIGPDLHKMVDEMRALQEQKPTDSGEWPLGPHPGYEKPTP